MGVLKTFTDELRRVQAERETQDLLEVLRRKIDVLTFGDLAGLITSALGKRLAAVKVSALFGVSADLDGSSSKASPASTPATATTTPPKKTRSATRKKAARKSKVKAKAASKRKAQTRKKTTSKRTKPPAKGKKAAAKAKTSTVPRSSAALAAQEAVLRTLAASAEPVGIRGVLERAKLSQGQATRTLRGLVEDGKVRMIGPKQRATYVLAQGAGSRAPEPPSPAGAPSTAVADAPARVTAKTIAGREAYAGAILTALQGVGDWTGAADLRIRVGGTSEQMRLALVRLVKAGAVTKTGERNNTRYKLAG